MKVGLVQFSPQLANLDRTLSNLQRLLTQLQPADLIVLPELCNSGYNFESKEQAWSSSETVDDSRFLRFLTEYCRQKNCHIVSGFNERAGDRLYNSALLVGSKGMIGKYRKLHLFMNEKDYFEPGNLGAPLYELNGVRLGMLICFDWLFPEIWRLLALKGADVICHPSNLVIPGNCQRAMPTHALTNRVFTVTANRIGSEGELNFTGGSIVCDTKGKVLMMAPEKEEAAMVVEFDPLDARDKAITARNDVFADRRPDVYAEMITLRK
jgi:predicted amidohydrolase